MFEEMPELPPGCKIERGPDGMTITDPWYDPIHVAAVLVPLGVAFWADFSVLDQALTLNPLRGGLWYSSRALPLALATLTIVFLQATTFRFTASAVSVRHGPFFWPWDADVRLADVAEFETDLRCVKGGATLYDLYAILEDGSRRALLRGTYDHRLTWALLWVGESLLGRDEADMPFAPEAREADPPWPAPGPLRLAPYLVVPAVAWSLQFSARPDFGPDARALQALGAAVDVRRGRLSVDVHHNQRLRPGDLDHLGAIERLDEVGLFATNVADEHLAHLKGLTAVRALDLGLTPITDAGLEFLAGLSGLETLKLGGCPGVGDAGVEHLRGLGRLRTLNLAGTRVSDAGLARLASLRRLGQLDVRQTLATEEGVARLKRALPGAEIRHGP